MPHHNIPGEGTYMDDDLETFEHARKPIGPPPPPCGCQPGGWVIMNADPERGELGQVQRCDTCRELASDESAWALAKSAGYRLDEDGNVLTAPAPKQVHELKTWPTEFQAVLDGKKRHETRRSDRKFRPGESVRLREWDARICDAQNPFSGYTGRELTFTIGHVTAGPSWGLPEDLVVFTLLDSPPPLALLTPSPMAKAWRIEGEDGAAGLDVAIEPDGTVFLAPVDGNIPGFALHPRAAAALKELLVDAPLLAAEIFGEAGAGQETADLDEYDPCSECDGEGCQDCDGLGEKPRPRDTRPLSPHLDPELRDDDGAAARQTREERADRAAEGDEPGRVEGVDRG